MNVLVLGGTVFYGRHLVAQLSARGHRVTTFNRGTHAVDAELPLTRISGDRTRPDELRRVPAEGWDAVVDPSSDVPDVVAAAVAHLRAAGRYIYISSVSAYDLRPETVTESSPTIASVEGDPAAPTVEAYGWRKATSEARVVAEFGARATVLRPGLIVGPFDPTDRFTYWPVRLARGGAVLVPGPPERAIQCIDVRDVAQFTIRALEHDLGGTYNVTSPRGAIRMRDLIDACPADAGTRAEAHWVDGSFLTERGCVGWSDLPLWLPSDTPYRAIFGVDTRRATAAGLRVRPLDETIAATRRWFERTGRTTRNAGLDPTREKELLDAWTAVTSS